MEDPLYKDLIIEHFRDPRNRGHLECPDRSAHVKSPTCGDELRVTMCLEEDRITEIRFDGEGCAISQASASIASDAYIGMSAQAILELHEDWVTQLLGGPVSRSRRPCASLHLMAVRQALRH
jgi:nitrogen fixation NifU-like protein